MGQTLSDVTSTLGCDAVSIPASKGCSLSDGAAAAFGFSVSAACQTAINNCIYAANAPGASAGLNINAPSNPSAPLPPSAGPISTPELILQTQDPTGSNVAPDAAAALKAYQAAVAAANTCPAGTTPQSDGTCAAPNATPWLALAGLLGVVVLVKLV
jgi:hypothetical protein